MEGYVGSSNRIKSVVIYCSLLKYFANAFSCIMFLFLMGRSFHKRAPLFKDRDYDQL